MANKINIEINEKTKSYPIYINSDLIDELKTRILGDFNYPKFVVVISEKVYKLYGSQLGFDKKDLFILKDGEIQKNFKNYQKILEFCEKKGLDRKSALIAIGGGVVGDITGFAAATYMRGISFVQVPTTLLACVDSSVGGKVAIDTKFGKNLVGTFYQPNAVYINLKFLKTLDERQFKSGLAEVLKYSFIEKSCEIPFDSGLFDYLNKNYDKILNRDFECLEKIIKVCIELKKSVVEKDEKESGLRKILNFGHTYGHALEKVTNYKTFTHGEAVIYGMYFIFNYASKIKLVNEEYKLAAFDLLGKYGFEDKNFDYKKENLIKIMQKDKKAEAKAIKVILPHTKGTVTEDSLNIEKI